MFFLPPKIRSQNPLGNTSNPPSQDQLSCMRAVKGPWADPEVLGSAWVTDVLDFSKRGGLVRPAGHIWDYKGTPGATC